METLDCRSPASDVSFPPIVKPVSVMNILQKIVTGGIVPIAIQLMLVSISPAAESTSHPLAETPLANYINWKSRAEQWGTRIKKDYKRNSSAYRKAETLYINAKAAADAWIGQVKEDIAKTRRDIPTKEQKHLTEILGKNAGEFLDYAESLYNQTRSSKKALIIEIINDLLETCNEVVKLYSTIQEEGRKDEKQRQVVINERLAELDQYRWVPFDKI